MAASAKDSSIETLRGLAILFVVASHVIIWPSKEIPVFFSQIQTLLGFIRMPLFTFISGYVYALRPAAPGDGLNFLRGKARRLLVPMLCLASLSVFFNKEPPFVESPANIVKIWRILIFPGHHLWFIQALFLIFMAIVILEQNKCLTKPWRWLTVACAAFLPILLAKPGAFELVALPFSINGAIFLFPYFLFGLGFCRFSELLKYRGLTIGAVVAAVCSLTLVLCALFGTFKIHYHKGSLVFLVLSLSLIFLLMKFKTRIFPLSMLGNYSYSIYLFHFYLVLAVEALLAASGFVPWPAVRWGLVFLIGLLLPILAHKLFQRFTLTRRLLLGLR